MTKNHDFQKMQQLLDKGAFDQPNRIKNADAEIYCVLHPNYRIWSDNIVVPSDEPDYWGFVFSDEQLTYENNHSENECIMYGYKSYGVPIYNKDEADDPLAKYDSKRFPGGVVKNQNRFTVHQYLGSYDKAMALVEEFLRVYSLSLTIDPSGNGCDLTYWPHGLSGKVESNSVQVSENPCAAIIKALFSVLLQEHNLA